MLTTREMESLLEKCLSTGATYAEFYICKEETKKYSYENSELDELTNIGDRGLGIRIFNDEYQVYASTNSITYQKVMELIEDLIPSFSGKVKQTEVVLKEKKQKMVITAQKRHEDIKTSDKIELLKYIDKVARYESALVSQVSCVLFEKDYEKIIANSEGVLTKEQASLTRLAITVYATCDGKKESLVETIGRGGGYEFLDNVDLEQKIKTLVDATIKKLDAVLGPSGEYPVILDPGFGAVIFHEACGHALEATSVAEKDSVFWDKLGQKIASDKVTLIDDGTISNEWGSMTFDDEGNTSKKNILIEKGILKGFLVDKFNAIKMKTKPTGSSRRESYNYIPTSRMTNTYLKAGTDKISDMFQSIDYGIYCKRLCGGTVNPTTGNFNFTASEAYLIEKGEITKPLKTLSLIGNNRDVLQDVEMVSDDLVFGTGYCGSVSGTLPVTCGQPTIKVAKMLIGGGAE